MTYSKNDQEALDVLKQFLRCGYDSTEVLNSFIALKGPRDVFHEAPHKIATQSRFWYRPATRDDAVLLVAHADVYLNVFQTEQQTNFIQDGDILRNTNPVNGLGGDDRCGCALVWLFRDSGHALLITDGEESGGKGAVELLHHRKDLMEEINRTCGFFIELDRYEDRNVKFYDDEPDEFMDYILQATQWQEDMGFGFTDIKILGTEHCSVNLSVGYHKHHTAAEYVVQQEWLNTYHLLQQWLPQKMPVFFR